MLSDLENMVQRHGVKILLVPYKHFYNHQSFPTDLRNI